MDSESLKIFCAVASELSVTQAAVRLARAPSNVTTRIQRLEAEMGAELFVRTGKRMALSTAGDRFLDYAKRLLALEEEARHVVSGGADGGALRMGSMESTAASRLPAVLASYHVRFPETRLDLITAPSRQLMEHVRSGLLDCAFVALPKAANDLSSLGEMGLCSRVIWHEELCLLLPANEAGCTRISDLRTRALAAFPRGCTYRGIAETLLSVSNKTEWKIMEMASYHAMVACVAAGSCTTLLPRSVLALAAVPETLVTLPAGRVETTLIWRQGFDVPSFQNLLSQLP